MGNESLPPWAQNLTVYRHECGFGLYAGLHRNNGQEWPVFQLVAGVAILCCPRCGQRLKLDHCRRVGELAEIEEEARCQQYQMSSVN